MTYFANPYESLAQNQIASQGVRYGFDRDRRSTFRVSRSASTPYGTRGYGIGGRTFERVGTRRTPSAAAGTRRRAERSWTRRLPPRTRGFRADRHRA